MATSKRQAMANLAKNAKQTVEVLTPTGVETVKASELHQPASQPAQPEQTSIVPHKAIDISNRADLQTGKVVVHKAFENIQATREIASLLGVPYISFAGGWVVKELSTGGKQRYLLFKAPYDVARDKEDQIVRTGDGSAKPKFRYYMAVQKADGSIEFNGREWVSSRSEQMAAINFLMSIDANVVIGQAKNGKLVQVYPATPKIPPTIPTPESEATAS
jgi:hypothetical protein